MDIQLVDFGLTAIEFYFTKVLGAKLPVCKISDFSCSVVVFANLPNRAWLIFQINRDIRK